MVVHSSASSPRLSALWSSFSKNKKMRAANSCQAPPSLTSHSLIVGAICLGVAHEVYYHDPGGLLGDSNGWLVSFINSVHATNYYWFRSKYLSRSIVGALILKYFGATLLSLALGEELIWMTSPRHIVSFLIAFTLVRSDTVEAKELSKHMQHRVALPVVINAVGALSKLRKLNFLVENCEQLGLLTTIVGGTPLFSMGNLLMKFENDVVRRRPAGTEDDVFLPPLSWSMGRNMAAIAVIVATRNHPIAYYYAKLAALLFFTWHYNILVIERIMAKPTATDDGDESTIAAEIPEQLDLPPSASTRAIGGQSLLETERAPAADAVGGGGPVGATPSRLSDSSSGAPAKEGLRSRRRQG